MELISGFTKPDKVKGTSHIWAKSPHFFKDVKSDKQDKIEGNLQTLVQAIRESPNFNFLKELLEMVNDGMKNTQVVSDLLKEAIDIIRSKMDDETELLFRYRIMIIEKIIKDDLEPLRQTLADFELSEFKSDYSEWWKDVAKEKPGVVEAFMRWKDNDWYKNINGSLYGKKISAEIEDQVKDIVATMQRTILEAEYPQTPAYLTVFRAFWSREESDDGEQRGPDFHLLKRGDILSHPGFLATSYHEPPDNFIGSTCCIMIIEVPAGFPCILLEARIYDEDYDFDDLFPAQEEGEILFPFGLQLEFLNIELHTLYDEALVECARFKVAGLQQ